MCTLTVIVHSGHLSSPAPLPGPIFGIGSFLPIAMGRVLVICINLGSDIRKRSVAGIGEKKSAPCAEMHRRVAIFTSSSFPIPPSRILSASLGLQHCECSSKKMYKLKRWNVPISTHSGKFVLSIWKELRLLSVPEFWLKGLQSSGKSRRYPAPPSLEETPPSHHLFKIKLVPRARERLELSHCSSVGVSSRRRQRD